MLALMRDVVQCFTVPYENQRRWHGGLLDSVGRRNNHRSAMSGPASEIDSGRLGYT